MIYSNLSDCTVLETSNIIDFLQNFMYISRKCVLLYRILLFFFYKLFIASNLYTLYTFSKGKKYCYLQFRATTIIPIGQLRIGIGEHNLRGPEVPASQQERVANAILHPSHKCGKYVDDIALLELARPISWSESVKPACLPVATGKPGYSAFGGELAKAAGWGWLGEDRSKCK